ncbi:MAG: site-specific integrase [Oscillospiraceae bacterium]|jgi:integrase|nr:site-specific integrase [Oscillospiraceae bacterium]
MSTTHSRNQDNQDIKVSGHLEDVRGIYQMKLTWQKPEGGGRGRRSISTGLPAKGNKRRAEDMLRDACQKQERELMSVPSTDSLLFADFMEQWLEAVKPDIRVSTYGGYWYNVTRIICPHFRAKKITLQGLTVDDINAFYTERLEYVKASSVHRYHANIHRAMKYAVEKGMIEHSIMDKVKLPKAERFVGKFLKQSEAVKLFDSVKGHRIELAVVMGAFYGLRRSEIVGLKWDAIDFDANTITIEHTVIETHIEGKKIIIADNTTKSKASHRTLPLVPPVRAMLLDLRSKQEANRKLCGGSYSTKYSQYIYVDTLGNRIVPNMLSKDFPTFMEEHGFSRMRLHDLRHSCASLLLASGVSLKQIQEWLGHSDFSITANTYAHLEFNSKLKSAEAMTWIDKTALATALGAQRHGQASTQQYQHACQ